MGRGHMLVKPLPSRPLSPPTSACDLRIYRHVSHWRSSELWKKAFRRSPEALLSGGQHVFPPPKLFFGTDDFSTTFSRGNTAKRSQVQWRCNEQMTWWRPTSQLVANKNQTRFSFWDQIKEQTVKIGLWALCQLGMWYISHGCVKRGSLARQLNR